MLVKKAQSSGEEGRPRPRRPWRTPVLRQLTAGAAEAHVGFTTEGGFSS